MQTFRASLYSLMLLVTIGSTVASAADRIWWEEGLTGVTTGFDRATRRYLQHKFYLGTLGPEPARHGRDSVISCATRAVTTSGVRLRELLQEFSDRIPANFAYAQQSNPQLSEASFRERQLPYVSSILDIHRTIHERVFVDCVSKSGLSDVDPKAYLPVLILRHCGLKKQECTNTQLSEYGSREAYSFDWLYAFVRSGIPGSRVVENASYVITSKERGGQQVSQAPQHIEASPDRWQERLTAEQKQALFEQAAVEFRSKKAVTEVRSEKAKFAWSAALVSQIPQQVATHLIDVLPEPKLILSSLGSRPGAVPTIASNELARSRIVECYQFRGVRELSEIRRCAGVQLSGEEELTACLGGRHCVPPFGDQMLLSVALVPHGLTRGEARSASPLPRITQPMDRTATWLSNCDSVPGSKTPVRGQAVCFVDPSFPFSTQYEQFRSCGKRATTVEGLRACLAEARGDVPDVQLTQCLEQAKGNQSVGAGCLVRAHLPEGAQEVLSAIEGCQKQRSQKREAVAACVATALGGNATAVARCLSETLDVYARAVCVGGQQLPPAAQGALKCMASSKGSTRPLIECMVRDQVPGQWQKPLRCLAEAGSYPTPTLVSVGACMLSDNLTPEQRILLECALRTGGEPTSFATCTMGELAAKELKQCKGKKFGEGDCFGENHEVRKLFRQLTGGKDLGSETVFAQLANVHLKPFEVTVALYEQGKAIGLPIIAKAIQTFQDVSKDPKRFPELVFLPYTLQKHWLEKPGEALEQLDPSRLWRDR